MSRIAGEPPAPLGERIKSFLLGAAKNPLDVRVFHSASLIAVLAWVGMGADGLSSSCYGPEQAFHALGEHTYLVIPLVCFVMLAVFLISDSYIQVIQLFAPTGTASGYLVASRFLGSSAGVVSGAALVIDYILTIAVSVASASEAFFSFMPIEYQRWRLVVAAVFLGLLFLLNLRGLKESITTLTPIFAVFIITHIFAIAHGLFAHGSEAGVMVVESSEQTSGLLHTIGWWGALMILMKAFSLGGGTYTGIEAVSNGLGILREPRAETGTRTMTYMSFSLAFTAGGLLLAYFFIGVEHEPGRTLNATLFHRLWDGWHVAGVDLGKGLVIVTLLSEAALLIVAAQAGFIGGPQVLANMASDSWAPHRFTNLSDRLVNQDGIVLMAGAAAAVLLVSGGSLEILVVMYSINVFITFSLTQLGMCRHWLEVRRKGEAWGRPFLINGAGLLLTAWILAFTVFIKFREGGWATLAITGGLIAGFILVRSHYTNVRKLLKTLDDLLTTLKFEAKKRPVVRKDASAPTAVLMVTGYNGLGIHTLFSILKLFPERFKNLVIVEVGTIDSSRFKGIDAIHHLEETVKKDLDKYIDLGRKLGFYAESRYALNVDRLEALEGICEGIAKEFKDTVFFVGKLVFERETWTSHLLHSQTALSIQKKLLFDGYQAIVMPIRVRT